MIRRWCFRRLFFLKKKTSSVSSGLQSCWGWWVGIFFCLWSLRRVLTQNAKAFSQCRVRSDLRGAQLRIFFFFVAAELYISVFWFSVVLCACEVGRVWRGGGGDDWRCRFFFFIENRVSYSLNGVGFEIFFTLICKFGSKNKVGPEFL